ncbi:MAG: c-type cytochrome biogenesis protein CcsB [Bacteroidales bacterium]|nr:c-type cytochrome biogenesis protein CcsB [Bacteroidales bacterium]
MKTIKNLFFSMSSMGILLIIFALSIGTATFIENDFGTPAAQALIYKAVWFDVLLGLLTVNLISNIFRYKMYRPKKLSLLVMHLSFIVILVGAGITRFISYEGMLHIRNGETTNQILSDRTYITTKITDGKQQVTKRKAVLLSALTPTRYHQNLKLGDKTVELQAVKYIHNAREVISKDPDGVPIIVMEVLTHHDKQNLYLKYGETKTIGNHIITFGTNPVPDAINIIGSGDSLYIKAPVSIEKMQMGSQNIQSFQADQKHPFSRSNLYTVGDLKMVLIASYAHAKTDFISVGKGNKYLSFVKIRARSGAQTKEVVIRGTKGLKGADTQFTLNGLHISMQYGSRIITLPFFVKLDSFNLQRYPGSMSPSSYSSYVTVINKKKNKTFPYHIYMNHVLKYKGYRFFQSSYDPDEQGSILSINHDYWGTLITYIGYLIMALGMIWSLVNPYTHFSTSGRYLKKLITCKGSKTVIILALLAVSSLTVMGQTTDNLTVNKHQAEEFGKLLVQSNDGRIKPMNTLASQVLRKISRKNSYKGMTPDQVLLGMLTKPTEWQKAPIIVINDKSLAHLMGIHGKYASYLDFINTSKGTYKLSNYVSKAFEKKPIDRDMFDKEVIKVDERMNIAYMIFTGKLLKMFPVAGQPNKTWLTPYVKQSLLNAKDSTLVLQIFPAYIHDIANGDLSQAGKLVTIMSSFQKKFGAPVIPSERKIKAELLYNKMMIFFRLAMVYGILGLVFLLLAFAEILKTTKWLRTSMKVLTGLIVIGFLLQTFGLGLRWYISGHAPWSDGYESMIYIGWVVMLAGLIFSRQSRLTVAATTLLVSVILFVAHLSWMDPEITNLVPVLKSYWLTIHVSVITASYGFLALGALMGFFNLVLSAMKNKKNKSHLSEKIQQLTIINQRTLTIGLYMLTIGTFLGGVWANESWGRYWSWDPKETWALVSVLVYSFVAHMRFIPGLKSRYSFNLASVVSYFSILMTYFGVNYYLGGMHSYAKGTPAPIPHFVYYVVGVIAVVAVAAYYNEQRLNEPEEKEL